MRPSGSPISKCGPVCPLEARHTCSTVPILPPQNTQTSVSMYIYMHTCMRACMHAYMHTCIRAYMHTCICAYVHMCIHTNACMHACMHAYTHNWQNVRIYVYIYMYMLHSRSPHPYGTLLNLTHQTRTAPLSSWAPNPNSTPEPRSRFNRVREDTPRLALSS